jgi:hypothetical protein
MVIFHCTCGQLLQVQDAYAGRKVRCPACKAVVKALAGTAPGADAEEPAVEEPSTLSSAHDRTLKPKGPPK